MPSRDFSYQTVAAVAASIVLFSVIVMGENREGQLHGTRNHARNGIREMGSIRSTNSPWAVETISGTRQDGQVGTQAVHDTTGRQEIQVGATDTLQPCGGVAVHGRRAADTSDASTAQWRSVPFEVSAGSRRLFDAIRQVESAGDDMALGDGGRSVGPYQCGSAAWVDGGGNAGDWPRLAYSRVDTEAVMLAYWKRYAATTDEQKARCWVAGPRWRTRARDASGKYWNKVKLALDSR